MCECRVCRVPRQDINLEACAKKAKTLGRCAKIERTAVFVKARALPGTFAQVSALVCARGEGGREGDTEISYTRTMAMHKF